MKVPCTLKYGTNSDGDGGYYLIDNSLPELGNKALDMMDNEEWTVVDSFKTDPRFYYSARILADADIILDAYIECGECDGGEDHDRYRTITTEDIKTIRDNNNQCFIEMYESSAENNSEESKLTPLLYCGRIVIHLTK